MRALLVLTLLLLLVNPASAELYCVANASQLVNAVNAASASASASEIRVRTGSYTVTPAAGQYALTLTGDADLTFSGGWTDSNCTLRGTLNPEQTVIGAGGVGRLMKVQFLQGRENTISISGISFRSGLTDNFDPACLLVHSPLTTANRAELYLDRNAFRLCQSQPASGSPSVSALTIDSSNLNVYVRNNVVADTFGGDYAAVMIARVNSTFYVNNNTFANNPNSRGLNIRCSENRTDLFFWVANNVFWNSSAGTLGDFSTNYLCAGVLSRNLIGQTDGALGPGITETGTISVDPGFMSIVDFRPKANSPLRNSGGAAAAGYLDRDFFGEIRVQGGTIDRGAHEFGELFVNGFE